MEMSITRALNELKLLRKKINKKTATGCFVNYKIGDNGDPELRNCEPKATMDSIQDMIKRRRRIKAAIIESNAKTIVEIGGEKMTVAEAIDQKDSIELQKELLARMQRNYSEIQSKVEYHNARMTENLDDLLRASFSRDGKVRPEDAKVITQEYEANNKAQLVDEIDIQKTIEELSEYIDTFENEVDLVLNESNARTTITIED